MAKSTLQGLTIEIGANVTKFSDAMKQIEREAKNISKDLKTVSENLKLDPSATGKVTDKLKLLREAADNAAKKVTTIKAAIESLNKQYSDKSSDEYKNKLANLERQLESATREQDLANEKIKQFGKETEQAGKGALSLGDIIKGNLISDAIKSGLQTIADTARAIGTAVWDAIKTISNSIKDFVADSLSIAEENRQTLAKVGQVFGESAKEIVKWSGQAVTAFGMTSGEAQAAAATFGNMFTALGVTDEEAAKMSMDLVQLAADVGAFNNVTTTSVLENFQSGLAGTSRQLREYGIVITAAQVEEKALAMGLAATSDELTEGNKIVARYALMMEQAAKQSGQFARESDSATVQTQILQARIKELKGEIGEELIPVQARLYELVNDLLGNPAIMAFFDRIVDKVSELAEGLSNLLKDVNFDDLSGGFEQILSQITDKLLSVLPDVIEFGGQLITSLIEGINKYLPLILAAATPIVIELFLGIVNNLPIIIDGAIEILQTLADAILNNVNILAPIITDLVMELVQFIINNLPKVFQAAIDIVLELANGIASALPRLVPAAVSVIMQLTKTLIDNLPEIVDAAYALITGFAEGLLQSIPVIMEALPEIITSMIDFLVNSLPSFIETGFKILSAIVANLPEIISAILIGVAEILASIINYFTTHWGDIKQVGKDLLMNIWEGIQSMASWFENSFTNWFSGIWSRIKGIFTSDANNMQNETPGISHAKGGIEYPGRVYRINDDAGHRPELFVPNTTGIRLNGDQTERILNNVNNSRTVGDLYIQVYTQSNTMTGTGEELGEAVLKKLRMSGVML